MADSLGLRSAPASVGVTITPVNDAPVAAAQTLSTTEDTLLTIPAVSLLAGATDAEGDPLTVTAVSGAVDGSVALDDLGDSDPSNDAVTFTPDAGFTRQASFAYTISDVQGGFDTATVTVGASPDGADTTILQENEKPGVPQSIWDAPISNQIEGFATDISVDTGDAISLKINVNARNTTDVPYRIEIYRLGPDALLGHKAYISVGHDEYWSGDQRANVEAARDAGVHLLFWSGNEVYWKTRYEASIDGTNTDFRTLISCKETWANVSLDAGPED
ncbi:hypothetical protein Salmuc_05416 [Salipiger mucosus DSM 16094]|uniref:RTX toxin n=1 Tax=Salipiger mucosus DSM 16094 TaxID=1123237 RepID=S9Q834_9RHOB|nr:hypothetical protein Salmuc_05416 [Salipiger mucosus DSM 16094]